MSGKSRKRSCSGLCRQTGIRTGAAGRTGILEKTKELLPGEEQKISVHRLGESIDFIFGRKRRRIFLSKDITVFMWETVLKQRNAADSTKKKQE